MKRVLSVREKSTFQILGSLKAVYRRGFSRALTLGPILLSACIVLSGGLLYAEGDDDALFIDDKGTVKVQELEVQGDINAVGTVKAKKFEGDGSHLTGLTTEAHYGEKVAPGLFEVHTRILWDLGWVTKPGDLSGNFFTYGNKPKKLVYAGGRTLFLSPLKGYGIPDVQEGATRKVRLYVNYGHQLDFEGKPTVKFGDVEFYLPRIGGFYGDMGANWSNFRNYSEYQHLGHSTIEVYLKEGKGRPDNNGTIYRIEAHFYDAFPE